MPSFAFWKSSKPDESKSPLLSDAAVKEELSTIIPNSSEAVHLNPGNQDSGVFLFDEDAHEIPGDQTPLIEPEPTLPAESSSKLNDEPTQETLSGQAKEDNSLLDIGDPSPYLHSPALVPEEPFTISQSDALRSTAVHQDFIEGSEDNEKNAPHANLSAPEPTPIDGASTTIDSNTNEGRVPPSQPRPKELGPILNFEKRVAPAVPEKIETNVRNSDSGAYMSDKESSPVQPRPVSSASNDNVPIRSRVSSLSKPTTASPQRTNSIARLQRPAELNLGFNSAPNSAKPKSELDMRYDLIRNSKTQSKATLRSPTQLLQDRLNMSPRQRDVEEKVRVFTPPRAAVNGCLLPGPGGQTEAFTSTSVRAKTEACGRPAWWCKFDRLVIFDGIEQRDDGELRLRTRTSKGLSIAKRRGDLETVIIPLDCAHCHEMLNRHEWKYDMRVCQRSVCWDCKERCKWELQQEKMASAATPRTDANRERADSMLQDEQNRSHGLTREFAV